MKFNIRIAAFVLVLVLLLSATAGCDKVPSGPDSETTTENTDTPVTTPAPEGGIELIKDGKSQGRIIRSDKAIDYSSVLDAAGNIFDVIRKKTGVNVIPETDWVQKGKELDHEMPEILVGPTEYSESKEVYDSLGYGEWAVKAVGNKLVIAAYEQNAILTAASEAQKLINTVGAEGSLIIPSNTFLTGVRHEMLNALPHYDNAKFISSYAATADAIMLYLTETDLASFEKYLEKLVSAGFKEYTRNPINGNLFATLNSDKYTVNIGYYAYENSVRITIQKLCEQVGLESENVYTKITTSQITLLGTKTGASGANGLSMLIRLEDGRFIIIDGAHNRDDMASQLLARMKEQSAEYRRDGEKIVVAAWYITHTHADHTGMITGKYSRLINDVKVERVLVNFLDDIEQNKGAQRYSDIEASEGGAESQVLSAARAFGAKVIYVHTGQILYFADLKMEILFTIIDFGPKVINAFNGTSVVSKMTFGGKTTMLVTGDATSAAMGSVNNIFGDHIKCDILQVNHHGAGPKPINGDMSGIKEAFKKVAPQLLLWPVSEDGFEEYKDKGYNVVLQSPETNEKGQNPNLKESYHAGYTNEYVIVPLPYEPGNVIVKRN